MRKYVYSALPKTDMRHRRGMFTRCHVFEDDVSYHDFLLHIFWILETLYIFISASLHNLPCSSQVLVWCGMSPDLIWLWYIWVSLWTNHFQCPLWCSGHAFSLDVTGLDMSRLVIALAYCHRYPEMVHVVIRHKYNLTGWSCTSVWW